MKGVNNTDDARKQCSGDPKCGMFVDNGGTGTKFLSCASNANVFSSRKSKIYFKGKFSPKIWDWCGDLNENLIGRTLLIVIFQNRSLWVRLSCCGWNLPDRQGRIVKVIIQTQPCLYMRNWGLMLSKLCCPDLWRGKQPMYLRYHWCLI